jgi:hypothetical protein
MFMPEDDDEDAPPGDPFDIPEDQRTETTLYVYTDADVGRRCGELYAHLRALPTVDEADALDACEMVYDLFAGEWARVVDADDDDDDDATNDYRVTD